MTTLKNYVISLNNATQRREHIVCEFGKKNISFEFFDAVTPSQINELAKQFDLNISHDTLTQGEYACLFSHLCLWQKMIDEGIELMAIFEDDVYLGENADKFLNNDDWLPNHCQLLKIEHFYTSLILGKSIKNYQNRSLRPLKEANLGTAGYIIKKDMAKSLLQYTRDTLIQQAMPIDHIMFDMFLSHNNSIYQLVPALCIQSDRISNNNVLESHLEYERKKNRASIKTEKIKLNFFQKIPREIKRLFHNSHRFIFSCKVEFQ